MSQLTEFGLFLQRENMSHGEFARISGIGRAMVTKYANGDRRPGLRTALLIQEHSGGVIPAAYWSEFETRRARPHPSSSPRPPRRIRNTHSQSKAQ